jgi:hypothetical protein
VTEVLKRMQRAMSAHDLEALVDCFAVDYHCEMPLHPSRSFTGQEHVHRNWSGLFTHVPDLEARVVRSDRDGDDVWSEWEMTGTATGGSRYLARELRFSGSTARGSHGRVSTSTPLTTNRSGPTHPEVGDRDPSGIVRAQRRPVGPRYGRSASRVDDLRPNVTPESGSGPGGTPASRSARSKGSIGGAWCAREPGA